MASPDVEQRIDGFVGKFTPALAAQLREARAQLRSRFPRGFELVFDNYNALVFGISPDERSSQSFLSIAAYPRWLTLFFLHGAGLIDPLQLLKGAGSQVRGVRLSSPAGLKQAGLEALIAQAAEPYSRQLSAAPLLTTVIKMVAEKQSPRRSSEVANKVSSRKNVA